MSLLSVSSIQNPAAGQPNILLNADGSVTLPVITGTAAPLQFQAGTLWFDTAGPALQIRNPANTAWVAVAAQAATLAEAAAGTLTTVYSSPETAVPKDAAGMTGAAILPAGTDIQRAAIASPVAGMTRLNTDYTPDSLEVYDGSAWKQVAYVPTLTGLTDLTPANGSTLPSSGTYNDITINAGVTVNSTALTILRAKGTVTINGTINANNVGNPGAIQNNLSAIGGTQAQSGAGIRGNGIGAAGSVYGFLPYVGSGGGSGSANVNNAGATGGSGGNSGGSVIIIADGPIIIGASAVVQCAGQAGADGVVYSVTSGAGAAGGGGGSGGLILLQSTTSLSLSAGSQLLVNGGAGGAGVLGGTITAPGCGGGGGGGGYIVLNSPSTTDSSTKNLNGGAGGASSGAAVTFSALPAGQGAGFGGAGGAGSIGNANGTAGSAGQTLLNVYI